MFLHLAHGLAGMELQKSHLRAGLRTASISKVGPMDFCEFFFIYYADLIEEVDQKVRRILHKCLVVAFVSSICVVVYDLVSHHW